MSSSKDCSPWPAALAVYLAALTQGLTLVSLPALSTQLRAEYALDDAAYGTLFLPQVALAIVGAFSGASLAARCGLRTALLLALLLNGASQLALAGGERLLPEQPFFGLLGAAGLLGLGFGLSAAPLNGLPPQLFPAHRDSAVVGLHTLLGAGLTLGPVIAGGFLMMQQWRGFPLSLATLVGGVMLIGMSAPIPTSPATTAAAVERPVRTHPAAHTVFWLYALAAVVYALAEGTFSNWAVVYLQEDKSLPTAVATLALSTFWGTVAGGRFCASALALRVPARTLWLSFPPLMIAAFLSLPYADTATAGLVLFGFSGLACSAFFPLTVALASNAFPRHTAWVSAMMTAALMVGVGAGSFLVGPLRSQLALPDLYRLSALYPALALLIAIATLRYGGTTQHQSRRATARQL